MSLWRYPSAERLTLYRNLGFGASAICFAILLAATQVAEKTPALYVSLYAACLGVPAWFVYGGLYDYYILLGKRSYAHFQSSSTQKLFTSVLYFAGTCLLVAVTALCQFLLPYGAVVFICVVTLASLVGAWFHYRLAYWWKDAGTPSSESDSQIER